MICRQTTHFAMLLSLLESREYVTEIKVLRNEDKKNVLPSGIGPVKGMSAAPYPETKYEPQRKINSRNRQVHLIQKEARYPPGRLASLVRCPARNAREGRGVLVWVASRRKPLCVSKTSSVFGLMAESLTVGRNGRA